MKTRRFSPQTGVTQSLFKHTWWNKRVWYQIPRNEHQIFHLNCLFFTMKFSGGPRLEHRTMEKHILIKGKIPSPSQLCWHCEKWFIWVYVLTYIKGTHLCNKWGYRDLNLCWLIFLAFLLLLPLLGPSSAYLAINILMISLASICYFQKRAGPGSPILASATSLTSSWMELHQEMPGLWAGLESWKKKIMEAYKRQPSSLLLPGNCLEVSLKASGAQFKG